MRRKRVMTGLAAACLAAAMTMTAYAGAWKQDETGWWYQSDDGSYLRDGWNWVDGKCYYFDGNGYCMQDTTTPDGYTVDGSGAWVVDGVVQTQAAGEEDGVAQEPAAGEAAGEGASYVIEDLTVTMPAGFELLTDEPGTLISFYNENADILMAVAISEKLEAPDGDPEVLEILQKYERDILDTAASEIGIVEERTEKQLSTGTWYCYRYSCMYSSDGPMIIVDPEYYYVYSRIHNGSIQTAMFYGQLSGVDMDGMLNTALR